MPCSLFFKPNAKGRHAQLGYLVLLTACLQRDTAPINPCVQSSVVRSVQISSVDKVDLLLVIDDSQSMAEEQQKLEDQIPLLVEVLTTGDLTPRNGTEDRDFPPVRSLRVGVVSTDMGAGAERAAPFRCINPGGDGHAGKDGVLQTAGIVGPCPSGGAPFFSFEAGTTSPQTFAGHVQCAANLGTDGCGYEQPLEAMLKAITPFDCDEERCAFEGDGHGQRTRGHGGPNGLNSFGGEPFVRNDSVLAIIHLTDEEDCSTNDPRLFNSTSTGHYSLVDPEDNNVFANLRCSAIDDFGFFDHPEKPVHPISRYVDGLLSLRAERPDQLVYAVIAGVPETATFPAPAGESRRTIEELLGNPRMEVKRSESRYGDFDEGRLVEPSCSYMEGEELAFAFPPTRLVQVGKRLSELGANVALQSICQETFLPAIQTITARIATALRGACLPRALNRNAAGLVDCSVVETLPTSGPSTRCDELPGRVQIGIASNTGAEICRMSQVRAIDGDKNGNGTIDRSEATGPGWVYDDFSSDALNRCGDGTDGSGRRISFVQGEGIVPVDGTAVRLECLQPVIQQNPERVQPGFPCALPGSSCAENEQAPGLVGMRCATALVCDPLSNTFQTPCSSDAECPAGFRCDLARSAAAPPICVNPSC